MRPLKIILTNLFLVVTLLLGSAHWHPVAAQDAQPVFPFFLGTVTEVLEEKQVPSDGNTVNYIQRINIRRQDTSEVVQITLGSEFQPLIESQRLRPQATVILTTQQNVDGEQEVVVVEPYRLTLLFYLTLGFVILVILVAKLRGFLSLVGMVGSLLILVQFMIPQILKGTDPMMVSLVGSSIIATITVYLSHGFNLKSHLALGSLLLTLFAVSVLATLSVKAAHLVGLGSEDAYYLQFGDTARINLQGLLLGGIILGSLGVLDDIVIAQVSVVKQLITVNKKLNFEEVYQRAMEVGKDHVASLVNTLVLAYAGANFPLFLLFYVNKNIPLWVTLNNQIVAEEIVRTLVGSIGLVLAVPLSTLLAAAVLQRQANLIVTTPPAKKKGA